jgi:hypothetical protein
VSVTLSSEHSSSQGAKKITLEQDSLGSCRPMSLVVAGAAGSLSFSHRATHTCAIYNPVLRDGLLSGSGFYTGQMCTGTLCGWGLSEALLSMS